MKAEWLGNLKGEDRENFKNSILSSKIVLDKLNEIVYNMYKKEESVSTADYDSPSWSHKQAHTNGRREALKQILDLITLESPNLG
jgi:hypothetical protein